VEQASHQLRDEWQPPFVMGLFLLKGNPLQSRPAPRASKHQRPEDWGAPSSFLQFVVSHAYSDGFSSVPLVHDFSTLFAEERAAASGASSSSNALLPLPEGSTFEALEARFFAALDGKPEWSHPDQLSLRASIFDEVPKWQPWVYTHEVLVEGAAIEALHHSAKRYGVPFDVVLLSMFLAASFKASWQEERARFLATGNGSEEDFAASQKVLSMPLTMYAPMRDGDLNEGMVGLFSDWRDATVTCSSASNLLGFCLEIAELIRHRRWSVFDPFQNSENILVNILPLDEQARGPHQFQQTRAHEYGGRRGSAPDRRRSYRGAHRPMRVTLEQEAPDAWWLTLDINADNYPTAWCRSFVRNLQACIQDLGCQPLVPLLRDGEGVHAAPLPPSPEEQVLATPPPAA